MTRRVGVPLAAAVALLLVVGALVLVWPGDGREDPARLDCSGAAPGLELALQDDATLLHRHYYDRERALAQIRALGVTWLRTNLLWATVVPDPESPTAPEPVTYDFAKYDSLLEAAERSGLCVQMTITGPAPAWATGDSRRGIVRPDHARFAQLAGQAAAHFRGRVARYSIWNEPNYRSWLRPQSQAPELYRRLYEAAHIAIRAQDAAVPVLIGETAGFGQGENVIPPLRFLREVACRDEDYEPTRACPPLSADGYAHHPYDFTHPPSYEYPGEDDVTLATIERLTGTLDRLAAAGALRTRSGDAPPVYLTEYGYLASGRRAVEPERAARYLVEAFEIASRRPEVEQLLQYLLVQPPPDYPGGEFNTGLVALDGTPSPAYEALRQWVRAAQGRGEVAEPLRR